MATTYLAQLKQRFSKHATLIDEISELYKTKLWHNITEKLEQLVYALEDDNVDGDVLLDFHQKFVSEFQLKLNPLKLASIVTTISQYVKDKTRAVQFLESVLKKIEEKKDEEAAIVLRTEIAYCKLHLNDIETCKKILEESKKSIDALGFVDNAVNAAYYRVKAEYLKRMDKPNEYYKTQLLYLAYTPLETLSENEQRRIAFDLGKAALLGDRIYNFGELLGHPVIESLWKSQAEWLVKLLFTFNSGNIAGFNELKQQFPNQLNQGIFKEKAKFLEEKIQLMAIMELVFNTSSADRTIPFSTVAQVTGCKDVELILLKALSLNLIKGVIDEVTQTITVSWCQPRVLDLKQIASLKTSVGKWLEKVDDIMQFIEKKGNQK